jgi:hypothetical protein
MKLVWILFLLLITNLSLADEIKIEINPDKPVVGEVFQAYFRIFTQEDTEPSINFNPSRVEVVGKSNQGVSTRTVYANGKLSVSREMTYVYDLIAPKTGTVFLRDITVQLGSKTIRHPMVSINVLKEPAVQPEVFVMADVPKTKLFLGEGIVVRYYLYSKVNINNLDVKKYPKLNSFLKRFLQEPDRSERVSVDGHIYLRNQIYAAKLFPEKIGELKIDPIYLSVTYPHIKAGDPFAAFGMSRDFRTRTISSEAVKVEVQSLPAPVPSHFTGLIGKHNFELHFNQNKLIVNQPLEVKLTVSGGGALENLEAPRFLKSSALEEFETNGDLKIASADQATKTFDYTFLAKHNAQLPASNLVLSYFDPDTQKFVPTEMLIPEITVAGGGAVSQNSSMKKVPKNKSPQAVEPPPIEAPKLAGPLVVDGGSFKAWIPYLNSSLAGLAVIISLVWFIRKDGFIQTRSHSNVPAVFRKGPFSLGDFTKWLSPVIQKTGKSPAAIIRESDLTAEAKQYFIELLDSHDYKSYSVSKSEMKYKFQTGYFKQLGHYIEAVKNESSSKPS